MHVIPRYTGWIEVVCGSMFSGKTEELIRRLVRAEIAKQTIQVFKPKLDNRYQSDKVSSHSGSYYAIAVRPRTQKTTLLSQHALPLTNRDVLERIRESAVDLLPVSNSLLTTFGSVKNGKKLEGLLEEIAPRLANRKELLHAGLDDSDLDEQVRNFVAFARGKQLQYRPAQRDRALIDLTALLLLHTYQAQEAHV